MKGGVSAEVPTTRAADESRQSLPGADSLSYPTPSGDTRGLSGALTQPDGAWVGSL
jgi:hypothetical protein